MKIVFFGTPVFASRVLKALQESHAHEIVAIVTKPDKPQGRNLQPQKTAVKEIAEQILPNVPLFQPQKCSTPEFVSTLQQFSADIFVVVAYGEIVSQAILDLPKFGCINIHASLLPKYRGAAPMQRCLLNGDTETGISIIRMTKKLDAGNILKQKAIPIPTDMNFEELSKALCDLGIDLLFQVLNDFERSSVQDIVQDESKVTFADKVLPRDLQIDWNTSAFEIHNKIRALSPKPGVYCIVEIRGQKKRMKILKSEIEDVQILPSECRFLNKKSLLIGTKKGALKPLLVQVESKPVCSIQDFLNGITEAQFTVCS